MTDFQSVLRTVSIIFFTCALFAVLVAGLDALHHLPLADYLVRKFGDITTLCIGAVAGLLAGRHYGLNRARRQKR
jgi:hypothetical protein